MRSAGPAILMLMAASAAGAEARPDVAEALFYGRSDTPISAGLASMEAVLPARRFPCANCHGGDGLGGSEGARLVPPIVPGHGKPARRASEILQALVEGRGSDGRTLDALMPRYAIGAPEAEALAAFLEALPARETQGISPDAVHFRVRPPQGAEALSAAFTEGLESAIAGRGAWGRRVVVGTEPVPAFVALAFAPDDPGLPLLAPLGPADPAEGPLRPLCATFPAEIRALLATLPAKAPVRVLGTPSLAARAVEIASDSGHKLTEAEDAPVLLLARDLTVLQSIAPESQVLGLAAQLQGAAVDHLIAAGVKVTLSDGCAGLGGVAGLDAAVRARRLGALTGEAVWQALARSGRNLTRSRFLAALDRSMPPDGAAPVLIHPKVSP